MLVEDWLRGCVHHDGRHGEVTLPCDEVLEIADYIESIRHKVEVVRCKDCKHRDPEDKKCDCGHDILWQLPRSDEWFCADAERRGDADED